MSAVDEVLAEGVTAAVFFGSNRKRAHNRYLRYARLVHPDLTKDARAGEAAARLNALWEEYSAGTKASSTHTAASSKMPVSVFKTSALAFFTDNGKWLIVNRKPNVVLTKMKDDKLKTLRKLVDGTPVRVGSVTESLAIAQTDGPHMAVKTDAGIVNGSMGLMKLVMDAGNQGILDGRDVAWIFKRILFLAGALDAAGIHKSVLLSELVINPAEHTVALVNPTGFESDSSVGNVRLLATDFYELVKDSGIDGRLLNFIRGCEFDGPSAGELLKEYDEVLRGLYGKPRFHKMRLPA